EAWSEAVCGGAWGQRFAGLGERIRRAADLEHWAAFGQSFTQFEELLTGLATGRHGPPPATVTVISGDIHHSYLAAVDFPAGTASRSAVYQAVCSPIHNVLPRSFRRTQQLVTSRAGELAGAALAALAGVRRPRLRWRITRGPWFHNMLAALEFDGRRSRLRLDRAVRDGEAPPRLQPVAEADLS
ncbi:MAG TPA: alkaline phosphatase family protein, partial [Streptosporangiaceae bacterium]|nr:alkaline phosphatase family protein [Streptosporangiaceae bacterium]